jgi:amidohydrolase
MNQKLYVAEVFEKLHGMPEKGYKEFKTSEFISKELKKMGYDVIDKIGGTGIVATLDSGKPGPYFGLRADMDALPYEIDGKEVCAHTCGHDANSSMVLATAKKIIEKGISKGKFFLIFQPAEEVLGGAESIIESGHIEEIEELVGIHLRPIEETRLGQATPALVHGASYRMIAKIKGLNSHGARPHLGVNAVDAAVLAVNAINAIHLDPRVPYSIKVTKLKVGETVNIIPDRAELSIDMRAQTNEVMDEMISKAKKAIINTAQAIGAEGTIEFVGGVPAAEYNDEMIELTRKAIEEVLGESKDPLITTGGEDFHFYTKVLGIKTAYIGLGADLTPGLHHLDMKFDKKTLELGVGILENLVTKRFN